LAFMVCAVLLPVVTLHFFLVFPRPKQFLVRRPAWTLAAVYGPPLGFLAAMLAYYLRVRGFDLTEPAAAIRATLLEFPAAIYWSLGWPPTWSVAGAAALVHSYRTARDATERNQVKWILAGAGVALAPIGYTLYLAIWWPEVFGAGGATWPMFAASAFVTA